MNTKIEIKILNKKYYKTIAWLLLFSLSTHFFFFHEMSDFNVICFEKDGSTNIEFSLDGKTCIDHNSQLSDNTISFTSVEDNNCKDISLSESNHNDDRFVIKKFNKSISKADLIFSSRIDLSVKQNITKVVNNFSTIQSNSIQQLKTVLLLI